MGRPRRRRSIFDIFDKFLREVEKNLTRIDEEMEGEIRGPYIYGFNMIIGPDGIPKIEEFSNISNIYSRREESHIGEEMEPLVEVIEREDEIWIIVELPGIPEENIDVNITEKTVTIKANNNRKHYKVINLPSEVIPESSRTTYRNGVLGIKLKKKSKPREVSV